MTDISALSSQAEKADPEEFLHLIDRAILLFNEETDSRAETMQILGKLVNIPPKGEAIVAGDIHGDLNSLIRILEASEFVEKAQEDEDVRLIFLGDYGDRGPYSPEVYFVGLSLKTMFPDKVVLLRGNHEGPSDLLASPHDLPAQLYAKFGDEAQKIYERLGDLFNHLYLAVLVETRYMILHGGVPSKARTVADVAYACDKHPSESHLEEILWSDPVENIVGTHRSPRGAGRLFGRDVTDRFLKIFDVPMMIRGHEPVNDGYKINHEGKTLTIFSRTGPPYNNQYGTYLHLDLSEEHKDAWQTTGRLRRI
jgi:diadenosine tetraphosphatase ApaH/serine/threonine PP2A family protein phosphatase